MKMKLHSLALLACLAAAGPGFAGKPAARPQPMTAQQYQARKVRIDADAKADLKLCGALRGDRKEVCEVESRGRADALKAELEARYQPSPQANQKAKNVTAEANFAVARAKCKSLKDKARDQCTAQAKLAREAAIRQAKVEKVQETGGAFASGSAAAHRKLPPAAS